MLTFDSADYRAEALSTARAEAIGRGFHADLLETELWRIAWSPAPAVVPAATRKPGWLERFAPDLSLIVLLLILSLRPPRPGPPRMQHDDFWVHATMSAAELGVRLVLFR